MAQKAIAEGGIGSSQLPIQLQRELMRCGLVGDIYGDAEAISSQSGTYLLFVGLDQPRLVFDWGTIGERVRGGLVCLLRER